MRNATLFITLVIAKTLTFGQDTATVSVNDITANEHIITFSGEVNFSEQLNGKARVYKEHGTVLGRNETDEGIIALVATIKCAGFQGPDTVMLWKHDFFFKPNGLAPNESFEIPVDQDMTEEPYNVTPITSYVTSELKFVQFDDGSVWGDRDIGNKLVAERADAELYLKQLLTAYTERGGAALAAALQNRPKPPTDAYFLSNHLQMLFSEQGTQATVDNIKSRLRLVAERRASGKF